MKLTEKLLAANADEVLALLVKHKRMEIGEIVAKLKCSKASAVDALEVLQERGAMLRYVNGAYVLDKEPKVGAVREFVFTSNAKGEFNFGLYSDQHICSKYARLDVGEDIFDKFQDRGIKTILNAGNWIDGEARFNKHDLLVHGMDEQCNELARVYPQRKGITTYAVAGDDHEGWYSQNIGTDIGSHAERIMRENGRKDWIHVGYMEAFLTLKHRESGKTCKILLMHPGGGSAYAISYQPQKIVESFSGGEKPAAVLIGHYHKMSYQYTRNTHTIQCGCFTGNTHITTKFGEKPIRDIAVGDEVLTHKGRYRKVIKLFERMHEEEFISINYGRKGRIDQTITATPEHPVLVERGGEKTWVRFDEVVSGDVIFVASTKCKVTNETIPYWLKMSRNANPMDVAETRDKLSTTRGGKDRKRGKSAGQQHMDNDVVPFCRTKRDEGWTIVPTGGGIIPDAIGFKDGRVVAFEIEKSRGRVLEFRKAKYEGSHVEEFIDLVEWVPVNGRVLQPRPWYEEDVETGFSKVKVVSVSRRDQSASVRKRQKVYNFEVEEDNSYVAGRVVVHNCGQDQTPFMRKKRLDAHVGGVACKFTQDPRTGALVGCQTEFFNYFVKGYYNGRWSHSGKVTQPKRI
jgi:hypothetical protein